MGKKYRRYKNFLEKYLDSNNGKRFFNVVYSVGAAIVILGAMFKILHLPFGNQMLMIGMITEAIVFLLSAFEKPAKEYKWEEVYPALVDEEGFIPKAERVQMQQQNSGPAIQQTSMPSQQATGNTSTGSTGKNNANTGNTDSNYANSASNSNNNGGGSSAVGGGTTIIGGGSSTANSAYSGGNQAIPTGSTGGGTSVSGGTVVTGGAVVIDGANVLEASEKYVDQMSHMSENMAKFAQVTESLGKISESLLASFQTIIDNSDGIGTNTQGYVSQMEALNRNISGLNTIYEIQLKGVSGQIHTVEEINAGLDRIKKLYSGSLVDSSIFKNETEKMAQQLTELNKVYARLLQAMTSNMNMGGGFNPNPTGNEPQP
uniref:type IX secretion system motor protein PorL/GldL n=1 Tax=uncultured Dysgonomonas sp. TaxID=206096 RepID=UPI002624E793|nr:gliding motility protein GldL [uncultured Dysgonomonas sp.]